MSPGASPPLPELAVDVKVNAALLTAHIRECGQRYEQLDKKVDRNFDESAKMHAQNSGRMDRFEKLLWAILWGGVCGLAGLVGIFVESIMRGTH